MRPWCTLGLTPRAQKYFLLFEIAGVLGEPRAHRLALADSELSPRLLALARLLHDAILDPGVMTECHSNALRALIGTSRPRVMTRRAALRSLLGSVAEEDLDWLLSTAEVMNKRLVSTRDRRDAGRALREAARIFGSAASLTAQARLRDFLLSPGPVTPIEVVPYVLSASCDILCGCALEDLIVLGVHPKASAAQIAGVVIHEAIHLALNHLPNPPTVDEPSRQTLDEALATALGSGWYVEQITGVLPTAGWYDNAGMDTLAKSVYPQVAQALRAGERLDSLLPALIAATGLR